MRFVVTLRDGSPAGSQTEVLIDAEARSPFSQLLPHLLAAFDDGTHPSFASGVQVWVDGVRVEQPENQTLVSARVRPGSVVELHAARERPPEPPSGIAEIRVINGPGAGRVHRLTLGHTVAGFGAPGMALADRQLPGHALTVIASAGGQVDVEPVPGVAATVHGEELTRRRRWPIGALLVTGRTVLELAPVSAGPATVDGDDGLTIPITRSPKPPITPPDGWPVAPDSDSQPGVGEAPAVTESEPGPSARTAGPGNAGQRDHPGREAGRNRSRAAARREQRDSRSWLTARRPSHRHGRRGEGMGRGRGGAARGETPAPDLAAGTAGPIDPAERARNRRAVLPDPASLLLSAVARDSSVWRRFPADDDFLRLRIGLGERDGLPEVPAWVDLENIGVLGIAGDPETTHALAAWLLGQCAVLHSPRQVRLAVLTTSQYSARRRWEWLLRVPHSAPGGIAAADDDPEPPILALIGSDEDSADRRLAELSGLIADRQLIAATSRTPSRLPRVVVLLDGARRLRGRPGLTELLMDGPDAGVYTICLDEDENWLPSGCQEVIACSARDARLRASADIVRPDQVEPAWSDRVSRLLAPWRDTSPAPEEPERPDQELLTMLGLDSPRDRPRVVETHWRSSPSGRVVIGTGHDGPFVVDLRLDGPHLLVAGDPAARPNALITVVLAALAAVNRPDHLNAILISTQPSPEMTACSALPHVTGVVDLRPDRPDDESLQRLQRALTGIGTELDRRDALLSQAGARDAEDYAARGHRLPRLVVAAYDMVELAQQFPESLAELVSSAQRGESLGLTLLMGTSRPEDIASHDIASVLSANASLRICLRVSSQAGSRAVIDAAEAARIPRSAEGRGYARTGHWPLLSFQAPRMGPAIRPRDGRAVTGSPGEPLAWALPWDDAGHPAPGRQMSGSGPAVARAAPLAAELRTLAAAADEAAQNMMISAPEPPWLPPLPRVVQAAALRSQLRPATVELGDPVGLPHAWALEERAESQTRAVASVELGRSGHLLVSGPPGSGRTTTLRTIAGVLADRVSAADLHMYALDCGDGALDALGDLPHTGALVRRSERARAGRVLSQLAEEVAARRETLTASLWADVNEQRAVAASDDRLPYLMLMVDRWETLSAGPDGDTLCEQVLLLLRRGAPAGLHVIVAGDRSLLSGRISALTVPCVLLQPEAMDYRLAGLNPARHPAQFAAGRGVWAESGVQVQVSVLSPDASAPAQALAIEDIARRRARRNASIPEALRPVRL